VPTLPFEYAGTRLGLYRDLPQIGEHNDAVARELGYSDEALERLRPSLGTATNDKPENKAGTKLLIPALTSHISLPEGLGAQTMIKALDLLRSNTTGS
jgi:hypothetical protein